MVTTKSSARYTPYALRSFFRNTHLEAADQFFLIDNDGDFPDQSLLEFPACRLLRNTAPLSFSANANQIIERCLAERAELYFLNNDVIFSPRWNLPLSVSRPSILSPLCNREVQYVSSVVVASTSHISNMFICNPLMNLEEYTGNEAAFDAIAESHRKSAAGFLQVYVLPFFCVKIPLSILEAVGRFDESFGLGGGEDFDYCLRCYLADFSVEYALASYNLHFQGKSSWAGTETAAERADREGRFRTRFLEKWGAALHDLILKEDASALDPARGHDSEGRLKDAIEKLMGSNRPAIKI